MKSFETWLVEDVENNFGIIKRKSYHLLEVWLSADQKPDDYQTFGINKLKNELSDNVDTWNEDEIKFHFIGTFVQLVDFITDRFKSFTQRTLKAKINEIGVGGRVDYMVATGKARPKHPFFFFHEYKPSKRGINDPLGQLLIEMVTAQFLNSDNMPLYGAYIEGRFWYFVILNEKEYSVSKAFDATENDIYKIFSILCKAKEYINDWFDKQIK